MAGTDGGAPGAAALSTILEEDFIAPLTAVRGALEILRDRPDLEPSFRDLPDWLREEWTTSAIEKARSEIGFEYQKTKPRLRVPGLLRHWFGHIDMSSLRTSLLILHFGLFLLSL